MISGSLYFNEIPYFKESQVSPNIVMPQNAAYKIQST
jgi:hypothetical protein